MKQSAIVLLVIGAVVAAAIYVAYNRSEGFWNLPSRAVKVDREFTEDGVNFWQTPNFQGTLSPRFSNVNYGPYIKKDFPSYNNMAVPYTPLGNAVELDDVTDVAAGFFDDPESSEKPDLNMSGLVPAMDGLLATYDKDGERKQAISYNRYMYANKNSRLRAQGDPFRGDLPIIPPTGNWFVPSVHPNIDLQAGALNVMGGVNNETSRRLASLIHATSGGTDSNIGGVDLSLRGGGSMFQPKFNITGDTDIVVTSFP